MLQHVIQQVTLYELHQRIVAGSVIRGKVQQHHLKEAAAAASYNMS
jgi:hypothetical protein